MEVPEENSKQVAKRKAIQEVMKDESLTPQERQKKIQQIMAASAAEEATNESEAKATEDSTPKEQMVEEAIQEEQEQADDDSKFPATDSKMPAVTAGGSEDDGEEGTLSPPPVDEIPEGADAKDVIHAIMRDTTIAPQDKQRRIQRIMATSMKTAPPQEDNESVAAGTVASQATAVTAESRSSARVSTIQSQTKKRFGGPAAVPGAMSVDGPGESVAAAPAAASAASQEERDAQAKAQARGGRGATPGAVAAKPGAVSSSGGAQAPTKGEGRQRRSREVKPSDSSVAASIVGGPVEPDVIKPGAAASTAADDPASRKGDRPSRRAVGAAAVAGGAVAAGAAVAATQPGVVSGSGGASDPAALKSDPSQPAQPSTGSDAAAAKQAAMSGDKARTSVAADINYRGSTRSSQSDPATRKLGRGGANRVPAPDDPDVANKQAPQVSVDSSDLITPHSSILDDVEGDVIGKAGAGTVQQVGAVGVQPAGDVSVSSTEPLPSVTGAASRDPYMELIEEGQAGQTAEVAPVTPVPGDAHAAGIQAFVADDAVEATGVAAVMSEKEEMELDDQKRKKFIRYGIILLLVVIVAVVVPVAVVVSNNNGKTVVEDAPLDSAAPSMAPSSNAPTMTPSSSPTSAKFAELLDVIRAMYDSDDEFMMAFDDITSPQYAAAFWAANEGSLGLAADDTRMIQRYALATFYFATKGNSWREGAVGSTITTPDEIWLTAENECGWHAVNCDNSGVVNQIFFPPSGGEGNNLDGTFPFEIAFLTSLNVLVVDHNKKLVGGFPSRWSSRLSNLLEVLVVNNGLTGPFPSFLLADNPMLGTMMLTDNALTGSLSGLEVGSTSLTRLELGGNLFTEFPQSLASLPALRRLVVTNMDIGGSISTDIGSLQNLRILYLFSTLMTGPIPESIYSIASLEQLVLSDAQFSGGLLGPFDQLPNLNRLLLNNNTFSGPVSALSGVVGPDNTTELDALWIHGNFLSGEVPAIICSLPQRIESLRADCSGDPPKVACECCTRCF